MAPQAIDGSTFKISAEPVPPEGGGMRPPSLLVSHQAFLCLSIRMCGKGGEMDVTDWFCCGYKYSIKGNLFAVLRG